MDPGRVPRGTRPPPWPPAVPATAKAGPAPAPKPPPPRVAAKAKAQVEWLGLTAERLERAKAAATGGASSSSTGPAPPTDPQEQVLADQLEAGRLKGLVSTAMSPSRHAFMVLGRPVVVPVKCVQCYIHSSTSLKTNSGVPCSMLMTWTRKMKVNCRFYRLLYHLLP